MIRDKRLRRFKSIIKLIITSYFVISCSDGNEEYFKEMLIEEFVTTYRSIIDNDSKYHDKSDQFDYMRRVNSDAFHSIAYRWHQLASKECELFRTTSNTSQKSSYEKVMGSEAVRRENIYINSDEDRKCLADVYRAHWSQINATLDLTYPNIR